MTQPQPTTPKPSLTDAEILALVDKHTLFKVLELGHAIADAAVAAERARHPKCNCGNPMELGIVHRVNGTCWVAQQKGVE